MLMWWKPDYGARMSTDQFIRLLDVCLLQHGMLGEGKKCAMPKESQCTWARTCVKTKDCSSPPLGEMLIQLNEYQEQQAKQQEKSGQNPMAAVDPLALAKTAMDNAIP